MHASSCIVIEDCQRAPGACASEPPHSERGPASATPDAPGTPRASSLTQITHLAHTTPPQDVGDLLGHTGLLRNIQHGDRLHGPCAKPRGGGTRGGAKEANLTMVGLAPSQFSAPPVFHTPVRRFFRVWAGASQNPKPNPHPKKKMAKVCVSKKNGPCPRSVHRWWPCTPPLAPAPVGAPCTTVFVQHCPQRVTLLSLWVPRCDGGFGLPFFFFFCRKRR